MPIDTLLQAPSLRRLQSVTDAQMRSLAELLIDCVDGGAFGRFMRPLPVSKVQSFWPDVA